MSFYSTNFIEHNPSGEIITALLSRISPTSKDFLMVEPFCVVNNEKLY
jgi:hypothetical protein